MGGDGMNALSTSDRTIDRRKFLSLTGGVAAAGVLGAACENNGGEWIRPGASTPEPPKQAAADSATTGSSDHAVMPAAGGSDRPEPSGDLGSIYDAALKPADQSPNKRLVIEAVDAIIEVAGGVQVDAWTFDGIVPGTVVHVLQGDAIDFTLRNKAGIGHSIDFHSAQTPWDVNYRTIVPDEELSFIWKANFPGVFMYHCGTGPVLEHIANGMYGAVVVDPVPALEPAKEFVLVQSEFYLKQSNGENWAGDADRMLAVRPDFVVFNGAALQYQQQPLTAAPGERIRMYVMNAGPTLFSAFHVIGAIFDKVYVDGNPANVMRGISTWTIPPGGGATFELVIPDAGQYPFVTHSFAYTGLGAVGLIEVK
jgi:nitrite reductase (NO-forming)